MEDLAHAPVHFSGTQLTGKPVSRISRKLKDLQAVFCENAAYRALSPETLVYDVASYLPVEEGTEAGLFFGITYLYPGKVGDEYFMTKGHFHQKRNRAEIYWCIEGEGMLLLMDEQRNTRAEKMYPGSLHYINGHTAHRTANTGKGTLCFGAVWPSDAGHDYDSISLEGFSSILIDQGGKPVLVPNPGKQ